MFGDNYKKAYQEIKPSDKQMDRILTGLKEGSVHTKKNIKWRPAFITVTVCIAAVCAVPVCAAGIPGFYRILEAASDELADLVVPIQKSSVSQGISMQVEGVYLEEKEAEIIISFADVGEEDHIRGKVALDDGYGLLSPAGDTYIAGYTFLEYDEESGKAYFNVMLESEEEFDREKLTFYTNGLQCNLMKEEMPIDLTGIKTTAETKKMSLNGWGGVVDAQDLPEGLWYGENEPGVGEAMALKAIPAVDCPVDEAAITGMAYMDGVLRLQICMGDNRESDRYVSTFLVDEEGNERYEDYFVSWNEEVLDTSYTVYEYWFIGPFDDLENYTMYGIVRESGEYIAGDWEVTFRLE